MKRVHIAVMMMMMMIMFSELENSVLCHVPPDLSVGGMGAGASRFVR